MAKQLKLTFNALELDDLVRAFENNLERGVGAHLSARDQYDLLDLGIRLWGAQRLLGAYSEADVFAAPWVAPVLRKALWEARQLPGVSAKVTELQAQVKQLKKPTPKPPRRRKARAPRQQAKTPFPLRAREPLPAEPPTPAAAAPPA